jgi:hypothetical protein
VTYKKKLFLLVVAVLAFDVWLCSGCEPVPADITRDGVMVMHIPDAGVTCYVYEMMAGISCLKDAP